MTRRRDCAAGDLRLTLATNGLVSTEYIGPVYFNVDSLFPTSTVHDGVAISNPALSRV